MFILGTLFGVASVLAFQNLTGDDDPGLATMAFEKGSLLWGSVEEQVARSMPNTETEQIRYVPASTEDYIVQHAADLGLGKAKANRYAVETSGCPLWKDPAVTNADIHAALGKFRDELHTYAAAMHEFSTDVVDLRLEIAASGSHAICDAVDLLKRGDRGGDGRTGGIFAGSDQLSLTRSGYVEPLLPPMRHPDWCFVEGPRKRKKLLNTDYLVHDFGRMCRMLKPTSRIVLFDLGASLEFMNKGSPAIYLTELFHKFGFPFDHIYAYEITRSEPSDVFAKVPRHMLPAYHWINVGVDAKPDGPLNPFTTLLDKYNEDDLIIVKLDIDTPPLELALAKQLLEDERLLKLVDHFYFEHHVPLWEMKPHWTGSASGTVQESFQLFYKLRQGGVAAHFWV